MEFPISIKDLFSPEFETNKTYKISTEFQITKMNKQDTKNLTQGELYTLTLSDADYSYSKFIYCKTSSSPEIEVGKYINIIRICPMILEAHKEKAFLITIKDIQLNINEVNHLNDNQIDCINYILIKNFEVLFTLNENPNSGSDIIPL